MDENTIRQPEAQSEAVDQPAPQKKKPKKALIGVIAIAAVILVAAAILFGSGVLGGKENAKADDTNTYVFNGVVVPIPDGFVVDSAADDSVYIRPEDEPNATNCIIITKAGALPFGDPTTPTFKKEIEAVALAAAPEGIADIDAIVFKKELGKHTQYTLMYQQEGIKIIHALIDVSNSESVSVFCAIDNDAYFAALRPVSGQISIE